MRANRSQREIRNTAVVVAREDGEVLVQNVEALELMGHRVGEPCWVALRGLEAEGLACAKGCTARLLAGGRGKSTHTRFSLTGRFYHLTCVALDTIAVCMLSSRALPRSSEWLTRRECDVLRLLADGESTASCAARLQLSESTVRTHVEHMLDKFGVHTRSGLVARAFRLGFLD